MQATAPLVPVNYRRDEGCRRTLTSCRLGAVETRRLWKTPPLVHLELRGVARRMLSRRAAGGWVGSQQTSMRGSWFLGSSSSRVVRLAEPGPLLRDHREDDAAGPGGRRTCATRRVRNAARGVDPTSLEGVSVAADPEPFVDVLALEDALTALVKVGPQAQPGR